MTRAADPIRSSNRSTLFLSPVASAAYFPLSTFYFSLSTGGATHCRAFGPGDERADSYRSAQTRYYHNYEVLTPWRWILT